MRVWYTPIGGLGTTHYPLAGFIYKGKAPKQPKRIERPLFQMAAADIAPRQPKPLPPKAAAAPAPRADPIGDLIGALGR